MSTGTDTADKIQAELALCWTSLNGRDITTGYCNSIRQTEGGTHVQGVRMSVPGVIRSYIQNNELLTKKDKDVTIESNDCFEGVYAIVSVKHMSPIFKGQHKGKLSNTDVQGSVQRLVNAKLAQWLEENPKDARNIANRVISAARARIAASKAKDQVRKQDAGSFGMNNFGKLKDCASTDITENELFIVEGDSAGGSASNGRNRLTQAIYSLRGKPLNSWELETSRVLSNNELSDLACAVGTGLFTDLQTDEEIEAAYSKIRYGKVVVLADADIDGCGRSDTLIATTSGPKTFKDLIDSDIIYKGYARNENGKIVIVDLHNPRITKYVTKLLKITLDNGREEFFTEDHPFRLKDGSYVEARCLTPDMDLDDVCLQTIDEKL
jgi:DNA gyrase subunit B